MKKAVFRNGEAPDARAEGRLKQHKDEWLCSLELQQTRIQSELDSLEAAQQELIESRNRYAHLYEFAPIGFVTLDVHGTILEINSTAAALSSTHSLDIVSLPFTS